MAKPLILVIGAAVILLGTGAGYAGWVKHVRHRDDWAFPVTKTPAPDKSIDPQTPETVPGAPAPIPYTATNTLSKAVDWFPGEHEPMPAIVARNRGGACGYCHLPSGEGRPENASLAGLSADYIKRQVAAMASGERKSTHPLVGPQASMVRIAKAADPKAVAEAADYFSRRSFVSRVTVDETGEAPKISKANLVYAFDKTGSEPVGHRILEGPVDMADFELRDSHGLYTAYVPAHAIEDGQAIADSGKHGGQACASCHGAGLRGGAAPPLAGRSPTYIARQLMAFRAGTRKVAEALPMKKVAAGMSEHDLIALAAYAASLKP